MVSPTMSIFMLMATIVILLFSEQQANVGCAASATCCCHLNNVRVIRPGINIPMHSACGSRLWETLTKCLRLE